MRNSNEHVSSSSVPLDYKFVEQFFSNGWVSQEYIPNILEVTKGSSAGTPLADLIYSMAMSRVLSLLRERMQFEGINSAIKIGDHIHNVVEVSFVDDVAIPVFANSDEIPVKTGRIVEVAYHAFLVFGMTLNFKANKSEGIVGLFGPGARKIKLELSLASYRIPIAAGDDKYFRFVKKYQHVGTILSVDLNMCDEITKRCGMMRAESRSLCSKILKCSSIPLVKKISVLQAYILSKGTFQCGTWVALPDVQYKRFHKCILDIYRSICGKNYKPGGGNDSEHVDVTSMFSDDDVIYEHGFINPRTMLRLSKLTLFSRIVYKAPPLLMQIIRAQVVIQKRLGQFAHG